MDADPIAELRAILAPLLDDPFVGDEGAFSCQFCRVTLGPEWDATTHNHGPLRYPHRDAHLFVHAPDCPVLRKDDLLGRA
jgi:hypothetical protein